jgi:hypothetical protein
LISCENYCNWIFKINYCFIAIIMVYIIAICVYVELWDNLFLIKWVFFFYKIYLLSHSIIEKSHISHTPLTILQWGDLKPLRHHKKGYRPFRATDHLFFSEIFLQLRTFMPHSILGRSHTSRTQCDNSSSDELSFPDVIKLLSMDMSPLIFINLSKYSIIKVTLLGFRSAL